jgi:hypothetical protein
MTVVAAGGFIDVLTSAIADISSLDVSGVEKADLAKSVLQAERLVNAANALSALLLERFERHGDWASDGALSGVTWTAERTGSARGALRDRRRQGAALRHLPTILATARDGRVSTRHLGTLGECVHRHPELAAEHEGAWFDQLETLNAENFPAGRAPLARRRG